MKQSAWRQQNPNFIKMYHGHLEINVPRSMFKDGTAELIEEEAVKFRAIVASRYPWLSRYALDEVMVEAQQAMVDHIESQKSAVQRGRELMAKQKYHAALELLQEHLIDRPEDADAWYAVSEVLFKLGHAEEGFRAISRARELSKPITRRTTQ